MPALLGTAARRLLQLVVVLAGLSVLLFVWVRALPGGPAEVLLSPEGQRTPEAREAARHAFGLDRPLVAQYADYVTRLARFDLGQSVASRQPVTSELRRRFPATFELAAAALLFSVAGGIPLGFLAARRKDSRLDHLSLGTSLVAVSVPSFLLAFLLKYLFSVKLGWLPSSGRLDVTRAAEHPTGFYVLDALLAFDGAALLDALRHLVLPAVALGAAPLAFLARITRAAMLEVAGEDYVRTAHAKGMAGRDVDRRHVLRNALLPLTSVAGLLAGALLSGAALIEVVFAWGGMGSLLQQAIAGRDYPVLQGGLLLGALVFVLVNLAVDLSALALDPRIHAPSAAT
ncbi:MAG: ABC transporter permease [Actinomycetota bacterium]|nr:ABC transporter permease [Actinomycetota bacterium]